MESPWKHSLHGSKFAGENCQNKAIFLFLHNLNVTGESFLGLDPRHLPSFLSASPGLVYRQVLMQKHREVLQFLSIHRWSLVSFKTLASELLSAEYQTRGLAQAT